MKISNSKKQLAKIIHENGGWRDGAKFAAQGGNHGHVGFTSVAPVRNGKVWDMTRGFAGKFLADEILPNWHQTILPRDEYFFLYQNQGLEDALDEPVVESTPTIEQLAADYRNRKDYAERKQQEADAAKADAEAKLAELVAAGKAIGLVLSVAGVEPEPELVITDWRGLQVGDEISVQHLKNVYSKSSVLVVGAREVAIRNHAGAHKAVNLDEINWSFIRRPARGDANA